LKPRNANSLQRPNDARKRPKRTAQDRHRAILLPLEFRSANPEERQALNLQVGLHPSTNWDRFLARCARNVGVCSSTMYRWLPRFEKGGVSGLDKAVRKDKGKSRRFHNCAAGVALVLLRHAEGCSISEITREVVEVWPLLSPGTPAPSRVNVAFLIRSAFPVIARASASAPPEGAQP